MTARSQVAVKTNNLLHMKFFSKKPYYFQILYAVLLDLGRHSSSVENVLNCTLTRNNSFRLPVILIGQLFSPRWSHISGEADIIVRARGRLVRKVGWKKRRPVIFYDHGVVLRHVDGRWELIVSCRGQKYTFHYSYVFIAVFMCFGPSDPKFSVFPTSQRRLVCLHSDKDINIHVEKMKRLKPSCYVSPWDSEQQQHFSSQ